VRRHPAALKLAQTGPTVKGQPAQIKPSETIRYEPSRTSKEPSPIPSQSRKPLETTHRVNTLKKKTVSPAPAITTLTQVKAVSPKPAPSRSSGAQQQPPAQLPPPKQWKYLNADELNTRNEAQLDFLGPYLELFPQLSTDEAAVDGRPVLMGRLSVALKIEQIYDLATSMICLGMVDPNVVFFTTELFWHQFKNYIKMFKQTLRNFIFSLSKLRNYPDMAFFDELLLDDPAVSQKRLIIFLFYRFLFQQIMEKDMVEKNILKIDGASTDLTLEVALQIFKNGLEHCRVPNAAQTESLLRDMYEPEGRCEYYDFMRTLVDEISPKGDIGEFTKGIKLLGAYREKAKSAEDDVSGFNRNYPEGAHFGREEPATLSLIQGGGEWPQQDKSTSAVLGPGNINSNFVTQNTHNRQEVNMIGGGNRSNTPPRAFAQPTQQASVIPQRSHTPGRITQTNIVNTEVANLLIEMEPATPLTRRIRYAIICLIDKFLTAIIKENSHHIKDPVSLHNKMNHIVVRKAMNLLTCVFKNNLPGFHDILRVHNIPQTEEAKVEALFNIYEKMNKYGSVKDSDIELFAKSVLKVVFYPDLVGTVRCTYSQPYQVYIHSIGRINTDGIIIQAN